ncbi:uncharacterized protein LOC116163297 isoform X1 [Photinus pyralis]|uniref:uncharacterized protein LOC116163297 isoform X1 n=1 Tax=Photinus pyralis TaxID=7054 RepID=UPI001267060A|nr:uncharacterized protein LOC116163297 isoform X1 [Photinus pyralis]
MVSCGTKICTAMCICLINSLDVPTADVPHNAFYSKYKSGWWDLNSVMRPLIQLNQLDLEYIKGVLFEKDIIKGYEGFQFRDKLRILDVGCGGGHLTESLARAGADVCGIDVNSDAIESAKDHLLLDPCLKNVIYQWDSIENHCVKNAEQYDIVIANNVLHHVKNHDVFVKSCVKAVKPGGLIFFSSFSKTFESWLRIIVVGQTITRTFPYDTFHWDKFVNDLDVEKMLQEAGCKTEGSRGIYYDIFSAYWRWNNNTNTMYMMHATKPTL